MIIIKKMIKINNKKYKNLNQIQIYNNKMKKYKIIYKNIKINLYSQIKI